MGRLRALIGTVFIMGCVASAENFGDTAEETGGFSSESETVCGIPEGSVRSPEGDWAVSLEDRFNYSFESRIDIRTTTVRAGENIRFDWSGLKTDMLGRALDPAADIDRLSVILFELTEDALKKKLADDTLSQPDIPAITYLPSKNNAVADYLSLLSPGGAPLEADTLLSYLDPEAYDPARYTFAVTLNTGEVLGKGIRMIHLFRPDAAEANREVRISDDGATLEFDADLLSAERMVLPEGTPNIVLDWSDVPTVNGMGNPFVSTRITEAVAARFADLFPSDLEERFVEMLELSNDLYRREIVAGTSVRLGDLADADGRFLEGITMEGTWIFALMCGECANPAPWYLAVLEGCPR